MCYGIVSVFLDHFSRIAVWVLLKLWVTCWVREVLRAVITMLRCNWHDVEVLHLPMSDVTQYPAVAATMEVIHKLVAFGYFCLLFRKLRAGNLLFLYLYCIMSKWWHFSFHRFFTDPKAFLHPLNDGIFPGNVLNFNSKELIALVNGRFFNIAFCILYIHKIRQLLIINILWCYYEPLIV